MARSPLRLYEGERVCCCQVSSAFLASLEPRDAVRGGFFTELLSIGTPLVFRRRGRRRLSTGREARRSGSTARWIRSLVSDTPGLFHLSRSTRYKSLCFPLISGHNLIAIAGVAAALAVAAALKKVRRWLTFVPFFRHI